MGIQLQGKDLSQEQLDAVRPVIEARMVGRVGNRKFEAACLEAMDKAGCPFILDDEEEDDATS